MPQATNEPRHPLASFLVDRRERLNLSKRAVGIACRMSPSHVGDIESGRRSPSADGIARLAKVLKVSVATLIRLKARQQLAELKERVQELEARAS